MSEDFLKLVDVASGFEKILRERVSYVPEDPFGFKPGRPLEVFKLSNECTLMQRSAFKRREHAVARLIDALKRANQFIRKIVGAEALLFSGSVNVSEINSRPATSYSMSFGPGLELFPFVGLGYTSAKQRSFGGQACPAQ